MREKIMREARMAKTEADGLALIDRWYDEFDKYFDQGKHKKSDEVYRAVQSAKKYMTKTGAYWEEREDIYAGWRE